jgi:hypothetical protein
MAYLEHHWNDHWTTSGGYSMTSVDNTNFQSANTFRRGEYASVNLLYTPVKGVLIGGEFLWGKRRDFGSAVTWPRISFRPSTIFNHLQVESSQVGMPQQPADSRSADPRPNKSAAGCIAQATPVIHRQQPGRPCAPRIRPSAGRAFWANTTRSLTHNRNRASPAPRFAFEMAAEPSSIAPIAQWPPPFHPKEEACDAQFGSEGGVCSISPAEYSETLRREMDNIGAANDFKTSLSDYSPISYRSAVHCAAMETC